LSRPRAVVVVTGSELVRGERTDLNGPFLASEALRLGLEPARIAIVGDAPEELEAALRDALSGADAVLVSGGLGPTHDDRTVELLAKALGVGLHVDPELEAQIESVSRAAAERLRRDYADFAPGVTKQATVPDGAISLGLAGTAPGLLVPRDDGRLVVVLPGPPGELRPMWATAVETAPLRAVLERAGTLEQRMLRLYGVPESEIALSLVAIEDEGVPLDRLEITTCLRRGEIEIATVFEPARSQVYEDFEEAIRERHRDTLFSLDGSTVDDQVIGLLEDRTVAVAESCTGGLMSARLTDRGGSSAYMLGGVVAYSNAAKIALADVPAELIERHGAVSPEVAAALADGARTRFGADIGIGITGIAGPDGGTEEKPVGTVCLSVAGPDAERWDRTVLLPGDRQTIRERTTTVVMHGMRRLLNEAAAVRRA
jgi:nicotinamide-nucleotide amidase